MSDGPSATLEEDSQPEISCRAVSGLALAFEHLYGRERLQKAYARLGSALSLEDVLNPENYVSFDFLVRLTDALTEESGDPQFPRKAGLDTASPRALGFVFHMLRAVGTPKVCYEQTIKLGPTYNRVGRFTVEKLTNRELLLRYTSTRREPNRRICELRMGQFAGFPTIWGLPAASIHERQCQVEGADSCVYEVQWLPVARPMLPAVVGAVVGAVTGGWLLGPALGLFVGTTLGLFIVGALGLALGYRRQSLTKSEQLHTQTQALHDAAARQQRRFEEILQLNATLEERVAERTRELEAAHARVQGMLDKQLELDRLKTQFFQNISHELRTPLTLILAPLDSIGLDDNLSTRARQQLEVARRSASRLLSLINQLLDMSRLEAGRMRLLLDEVDPASLAGQLVHSAQPLARQRGIELTFESRHPPSKVPLDVDKFDKSLLNLLSNALKFTAGVEGRPARVHVVVEQKDGRLLVSVSDTGIGIPEAELENVFERFHQVDGSSERQFGGTGIGLALVREFIEFHCGTISVTSAVNEGSTFTIDLPTSLAAYPPERLDRRREQTEVSVDRRNASDRRKLQELIENPADLGLADLTVNPAIEPPDDTSTPRPVVLIADDNRDMLAYLASILAREYEIIAAGDGEAAYELAVERQPQLVISDVMMPRKNGHALVRDLRRNPVTRSIPVILVTAKADVYQRVQGIEEGADDYLTKPFNFLELRARIRQLLKSRALERSLAERNEHLARVNFELVLSRKEVFLKTVDALTAALESRDRFARGHSRRVAALAVALGEALQVSRLELERLHMAALLHDVGMLELPDTVLNKPAPLDAAERAIVEEHPDRGFRILEGIPELADVSRCILLHHERFDGTGYPKRLQGQEIPMESRVLAVAEAYDAMRSERPWRAALSHDAALGELRNGAGTQFDPAVVDAFMRLYEAEPPEVQEHATRQVAQA